MYYGVVEWMQNLQKKKNRGKWNLKTQNGNEPVQRDKLTNFIYVPSTKLAAENRQNKTQIVALQKEETLMT